MTTPLKKPRALTKKQLAFRDAILAGFNPSQAYRKAYDAQGMSPRAISANAGKLLKQKQIALAITLAVRDVKAALVPALSPKVRLSMEHRLEVMEAAIDVDPADYFNDLNHFLPIREMPKHVRMAIAGFKVDPVSFVTEVKFVDRINATRLYSQLAGDIPKEKESIKPSAPSRFDLTKLSDDELREHLRLRKKAMIEGPEP